MHNWQDLLFELVSWVEHMLNFILETSSRNYIPRLCEGPTDCLLHGSTGLFEDLQEQHSSICHPVSNPLSQRQRKRHYAHLYIDWCWPTSKRFTFPGSTMTWHVPWTSGSIPMTPKFVGSSMRAVSFCPHLHNNYSQY